MCVEGGWCVGGSKDVRGNVLLFLKRARRVGQVESKTEEANKNSVVRNVCMNRLTCREWLQAFLKLRW